MPHFGAKFEVVVEDRFFIYEVRVYGERATAGWDHSWESYSDPVIQKF